MTKKTRKHSAKDNTRINGTVTATDATDATDDTFYLGKVKIQRGLYGYWIYPRDQRGRYVEFGSSTAQKIEDGVLLEAVNRTRRQFKEGTHEPVVYYRDADGRVGIPPDPSLPVPDGSTRFTLDTLAEADKLSAEIAREQYKKWQDYGAFTEMMDANLGDPVATLHEQLTKSHSNLERDTIRMMIRDLEDEGYNRQRVHSEAHFHFRENDSRGSR